MRITSERERCCDEEEVIAGIATAGLGSIDAEMGSMSPAVSIQSRFSLSQLSEKRSNTIFS
jgi:hypothetical protein